MPPNGSAHPHTITSRPLSSAARDDVLAVFARICAGDPNHPPANNGKTKHAERCFADSQLRWDSPHRCPALRTASIAGVTSHRPSHAIRRFLHALVDEGVDEDTMATWQASILKRIQANVPLGESAADGVNRTSFLDYAAYRQVTAASRSL